MIRNPTACNLAEVLPSLEKDADTGGNRIFYLATPPGVYEDIIGTLHQSGLATQAGSSVKLVIEKPFGHDLESSQESQCHPAGGIPGKPGLPHRSLSGQGDRPEHPHVPFCQLPVRATLEQALHRSCADNCRRNHRHRAPRRLLRASRCAPGHVPEPHVPACSP